jgi:transcriptional regulator with XRE-family HTH domain
VLPRHRMMIAREYARLTQAQLAEAMGVAFQTISAWESGHRQPGSYELRKFAKECGVDVQWLAQDLPRRRIVCPVCRREVAVSSLNHVVVLHNDKAYRPCDMGGCSIAEGLLPSYQCAAWDEEVA